MTIAVVILNWNGKALLEQFLPSVVAHSQEATLYMADNASTDDSVSYVSRAFPSVKIIRNAENGGYAKGYNDALRSVSEDIYILLNSDVAVTQNWLQPIRSEFEKYPNLVAAQPKILDFKNKAYFEYAGAAGGFIDKLGYPYCRGRIFSTLEKDVGQYDDTTSIFWASGACLFVRNSSFWEVDGFDEDFFAHQEEIDLCWRLQSLGGTIRYYSTSTVFHLGGATLSSANPKKTFYNFRNTLLMLVKNVRGGEVWWLIFKRMILDGVAGFQMLAQGKFKHFFALFKAHISFYMLLPKFIQKRKKWASTIKYQHCTSIVWQYFVKGRVNFKKLR
jgi:GT2 family glycosyltransferase